MNQDIGRTSIHDKDKVGFLLTLTTPTLICCPRTRTDVVELRPLPQSRAQRLNSGLTLASFHILCLRYHRATGELGDANSSTGASAGRRGILRPQRCARNKLYRPVYYPIVDIRHSQLRCLLPTIVRASRRKRAGSPRILPSDNKWGLCLVKETCRTDSSSACVPFFPY